MPLNAVTTQRLVQIAELLRAAPQGGKRAVLDAACLELGVSLPTLYRHLEKVSMKPERKTRSDAGDVSLTREEALAISAILMTSHRKNNKRELSIGQAVEIARANGEVRAERVAPGTGEIVPLSESAIARALRAYALHPDQLTRPTPATELRSLHPNHVWSIDASLCVLYYINPRTEREAGLQVMEREQFYKNKPANLKRIEQDRVWSYEATDHFSGAIKVRYVLGAESGANLTECFLEFIQQREGDPMHGVPLVLMMDMGSANTGGLFTNLLRRLQVKQLAHMPGVARATGQVEQARDLIERSFESSLRLRPVADLDELNTQAQRWARWFNGNKVHTRHGKTRYDQWMTIAQAQLRIAPSLDLCRQLLTHEPEQRKVTDMLTVQFDGREFDVRHVPNIMVGEKVLVALNPYQPDAACVVERDADGNEALHTVPEVARDDAGFRVDGNVIGEDYRRLADTRLDINRKEVERFAYDAATQEEAEAKKKAKAVPFGGRIDPYKVIEQAPERTYLPRRGEQLVVATKTIHQAPPQVLKHFAAATALKAKGVPMSPELVASLKRLHPDGVPEDQLDALVARFTVRVGLRVVQGGGE